MWKRRAAAITDVCIVCEFPQFVFICVYEFPRFVLKLSAAAAALVEGSDSREVRCKASCPEGASQTAQRQPGVLSLFSISIVLSSCLYLFIRVLVCLFHTFVCLFVYFICFSFVCLCVCVCDVCLQAELQSFMVGSDTVDPIITEIVATVC